MATRVVVVGGTPGLGHLRSSTPPEIGIFYSREDKQVRASIREHLAAREFLGELKVWDDQSLPLGEDWEREIEVVIKRIKVAVVLISPPFTSSQFCQNREVPLLRERLELKQLRIIPVLVRHSDLEHEHYSWLKSLQFFPGDDRALLNDFAPEQLDRVLTELVQAISQILTEMEPDDQPDPPTSPAPAGTRLWHFFGHGTGNAVLVDARSRFGRGKPRARAEIFISYSRHDYAFDPYSDLLEAACGLPKTNVYVHQGLSRILLLHQELRSVHHGGAGLRPWGEGDALSRGSRGKRLITMAAGYHPGPIDLSNDTAGRHVRVPLIFLSGARHSGLSSTDEYQALSRVLLLHQELRSVHFGGAGLCPWGEGSVLNKDLGESLNKIFDPGYSTRPSNNTSEAMGVTREFDPMGDKDQAVPRVVAKKYPADRLAYINNLFHTLDRPSSLPGSIGDVMDRGQINCTKSLFRFVKRADWSGETLFKDPVQDRLFKKWILKTGPAAGPVFKDKEMVCPAWMTTEPPRPDAGTPVSFHSAKNWKRIVERIEDLSEDPRPRLQETLRPGGLPNPSGRVSGCLDDCG